VVLILGRPSVLGSFGQGLRERPAPVFALPQFDRLIT
jgi:hypothetical protein